MASRYRVVSVPTVVVLDNQENPVGAKGGFMTAEKLLAFVGDSLNNPAPIPPAVEEMARGIEEANDSELSDAVDLLIREMANNRSDREQMLLIVKKYNQKIQPRLITWLQHTELRTRAAAGLAIAAGYDIQSEFDPFADLATRKAQIAKIQKLLTDAN